MTYICLYIYFYNYPLPILRSSPYSPFYPSFFNPSYAIYVRSQCFDRVNLTIQTATIIQTRKLDESCQKFQDPREPKLARKKVWVKRTKKVLMDHFKVVSILLLKNISSEITHANFVVSAMNDEVSSISSQLVEQIEIFLK